jgi:predicted nucleotidyltransferase
MAAYEIVEKYPEVLGVLLYGSVAKGNVDEESDVDLLVVSENLLDLADDEYEISMKYGVAFGITSMVLTEFLAVLRFKSAFLFGILEGYDVLFDRSRITTLLNVSKKDVYKNWRYNTDEGLWVKLRK